MKSNMNIKQSQVSETEQIFQSLIQVLTAHQMYDLHVMGCNNR